MDKLGVKPDSRVAVLGVPEESFLAELSEQAAFYFSRDAIEKAINTEGFQLWRLRDKKGAQN